MVWIIIISSIVLYLLYVWSIDKVHDYFAHKKYSSKEYNPPDKNDFYKEHPSAKDYVGKEHKWEPTYNLTHNGVKLMNIPFTPDKNEIFYLENEYDELCNKFIIDNYDLIREKLKAAGMSFVYLPYLRVDKEMMTSMISYRYPQGNHIDDSTIEDCKGLQSNFLLDYMVHPENRPNIKHGFAWYGKEWWLKRRWYQFDYISFDGKEALEHPEEVLAEILIELGQTRNFREGWYSQMPYPDDDGSADQHFDEETKKMLEEVRQKLDSIRLRGISEAAIAKYISPNPTLSHLRVTNDLCLILDEYNGLEIKMEPLVKATYLLFLRHKEGIEFKDMPDHRRELEIIYRAIRQKNNDIDQKLGDKTFMPIISENIKKLTNPFNNSINEKCTRIKEAFLLHFHESIAEKYYVIGGRASSKFVFISKHRDGLIIWEGKE